MKRLNYLAACGLMFTAVLAFTGCSDDDDEGGNGAPKGDNSYITSTDGDKLLLTQAGHYNFSYNAEGLLTGFSEYGHDRGTVTYNPMKIAVDHGDDEIWVYNIGLNGAGFISSISYSYSDSYGSETGTCNLSYDGSGRISKVSVSGSGTDIDEGETYKYSGNSTSTFTYSDGKLTKMATTMTGNDGGERYTETETLVYEYASDAPANTLGQFSNSLQYAIDDIILDDEMGAICFVGLFGKPSSYFPTSVTGTWTESDSEEDDTETYTYNASYSFNSNGTIESERFGYSSYKYSYSNAPAASTSAAKSAMLPNTQKSSKKHGFFRSHRNR